VKQISFKKVDKRLRNASLAQEELLEPDHAKEKNK